MLSYLKRRIQGHMLHDVGSAFSAGASIIGAGMQSDSADSAADAQAAMYNRTRADLSPYRSVGTVASNKLLELLGLSYAPAPIDKSKYQGDPDGYKNALAGYNRKLEQYNTSLASPEFGSLMSKFTGEDLADEPGYQFGMDQGMQALDRGAAARGNYLSGAALKAGQRYAQDYAGTKFNDAYQRDNNNKNRAFNWLAGLTNVGQNSAAQQASANQQNATAQGNLAIQQGNAMSAGLVGAANAYTGYQDRQFQNNLLSSLNNNQSYSAPSGGGGWNMGNWGWSNGSDSWG